ncbi:MBL fold metallo-hydrolase [Bacillus sp. FJAT-27251]|uniref:MBL fold metallo-hydrolase n=1 Tax=Bacillus sp. FJAT-27251 TaxID=1684142 RepID=UPI0006A773A4|nr:MBL fold metallo-hydrolase [Bacillus sp. FJAT-27251]
MEKITVTMTGTGSPRPEINRSGPSQVLSIGDTHILIDCGENVVRQIQKAQIPLHQINYLFMTHLHADHLYGYGHFLVAGWGSGRKELTVVGPKGTKKFHEQMLEIFKDDIGYRTSLGFSPAGIMDVRVIEVDEPGQIELINLPATVTAANMIHNVPTFAYRFQIGSQAVVISGDTAPTDELVKLSQGADILIQDACLTTTSMYNTTTRPEMKKVWENLQKEHCTPKEAAETAQNAGVKQLILTHFLPEIDIDEIYREASEIFSGIVVVPNDLDVVSIEMAAVKS